MIQMLGVYKRRNYHFWCTLFEFAMLSSLCLNLCGLATKGSIYETEYFPFQMYSLKHKVQCTTPNVTSSDLRSQMRVKRTREFFFLLFLSRLLSHFATLSEGAGVGAARAIYFI